ncbi:SgcJ/EcaC family oxidoreductase [Microbacterium sp. XT11]|uniref:SgcJ/EcaC family oxidoreductase n=1 Tax=Microbacterium sp. XT11 TaxID=367477 RepID=UPI000742CF25|nr:SgcJ/EcaC family oxidoreductase [Microbacterium sp. XT11]ALX67448.1 hypothetical protein AB663_003400 [Microbacterium sp. XT11]
MDLETLPAGLADALDRIRDAWNAGDADAYAEQFTDDATYVIFAGLVSHGRTEIRDDHVPVFEKWQRGSRMSMRIIDVRMLGADAAVVVTEGGVGKREPVAHDKVQTFVFVRDGERWRCAAFQNTKRNRLLAAMNVREKKRLAAA